MKKSIAAFVMTILVTGAAAAANGCLYVSTADGKVMVLGGK